MMKEKKRFLNMGGFSTSFVGEVKGMKRVKKGLAPLDEGEMGRLTKAENIDKALAKKNTKGFQEAVKEGRLIGFPIVGVRVVLNDGAYHDVDSSENAFKTAALMGFREAYEKAGAAVLEPIMKLEAQAPEEFQGSVMGQINQRRGMIVNSGTNEGYAVIEAEVPLSEMFGYSTDLRSATQGKGEFTMEFLKYSAVPRNVQEEMVKKYQEKKAKENK
jgi:elongation factor G